MANYNSSHTGQQIDSSTTAALNPDTTPTQSSGQLVTSGGVFSWVKTIETALTALIGGKQNQLTFDTSPTDGSTNPVQSKGIKAAIDAVRASLSSAVTTINSALSGKAPINSPSFTGTPRVPTQSQSDNGSAAANTAFVQTAKAGINANIADQFDATKTYGEDDFVFKDDLLYKFLSEAEHLVYRTIDTDIYRDADGKIYRAAPVILWDGADVVQTVLANEVTKLFHRVPPAPMADGTYSLKVTVSGGVPSYSWISD